jgi:molecular chaperone Hsp33
MPHDELLIGTMVGMIARWDAVRMTDTAEEDRRRHGMSGNEKNPT